ncbi:unnamed protein product [Vicia faba]|uniref:Uncharacterized protein n=1 Tax=Vicia faba TaxID=3906 RepID=A0AAV1A3F5_VICFA|nr:unnamed protein product [Vicia faba]
MYLSIPCLYMAKCLHRSNEMSRFGVNLAWELLGDCPKHVHIDLSNLSSSDFIWGTDITKATLLLLLPFQIENEGITAAKLEMHMHLVNFDHECVYFETV